jgi:hypothetical protein
VNLKNVLKICKQLAKRLRLQLFLTISARFPQRQWSRNRTFYFSKKPRKIREKILKEKAQINEWPEKFHEENKLS